MEIQARGFGDALNEWFRSLGRNWKPLLASSLMAYVPLAIVLGFSFWLTGSAQVFELYLNPEELEGMTDVEVLELLTPFLWTFAIWMILQLVAGAFVYLASARTVAGDLAGFDFSWRDVSRFGASRTATAVAAIIVILVGSILLIGLAIAAGWAVISTTGAEFLGVFLTTTMALTVVVVLVWLGVSVSMAFQAIAMEDIGPANALVRSFQLVRSRWWVTLGFVLIAGTIASAASQVAGIVLVPFFLVGGALPEVMAVGFAGSVLLQGPLLAAIGAAYAIWYVDLRAREEPIMAEQLL